MNRRSSVRKRSVLFAAGLALLAVANILASSAAAHEDITLLQDAGGKLVTGISEVGTTDYTFPMRVYEGAFNSIFRSNDPGFVAPRSSQGLPAGTALLPAHTGVRFDLRAFNLPGTGLTNLAYWDGSGEVAFAPVAPGYSLTMSAVEPGTAIADGSPADVAGFLFANTDDQGGIHEHMIFDLARSGGTVAEGIYMWSLDLKVPGLEDSDPFFILHETSQAPLTLDEAVDWVNANLDTLTVPEPPTALLAAIAGLTSLALGWRRRRVP
jgi:hypothetical protein